MFLILSKLVGLVDWLIDAKHQSINQSTKPTSFHSLMLPARWKSSQYQFYSHWFYTNRIWNQRSNALEQACQSVHVVATMRRQYLIYVWAFLLDLKYMVVAYSVKCHFQQYFSYIVAVSFIGGWNRSTRRKPLTCRKSDELYHIKLYCLSGIRTHNVSGDRYWLHR